MDRPVILLVDDERSILNALQRALRRRGYRLLTAASGEEAMEILARQQVSLIVSDYRMPGMNGEELLIQVKSLYPQIRRVMLTGFPSVGGAGDVFKAGNAEQLLMKPWDIEKLRSTINSLLVGDSAAD